MFQVTINITGKKIADLLVSAFEGGSNYWCDITSVSEMKPNGTIEGETYPNYITALVTKRGMIEVFDRKSESDTNTHGKLSLNFVSLQDGLEKMASQEPRHFGDFLAGTYDGVTADVFLQCALFGKVIYG